MSHKTLWPLLVINAGSSSVKVALFDHDRELLRVILDQSGSKTRLVLTESGRTSTIRKPPTLTTLGRWLRHELASRHIAPATVAHRFVHGGGSLFQPTKLDRKTIKILTSVQSLAPLHLPVSLNLATQALRAWPEAVQWTLFDTEPYQHLAPAVRTYAIPLDVAKKFGIRKYGFHGISHRWALQSLKTRFHRAVERANVITLHLGSGDSMTLWVNGQAVDTSMGFTPLEGLTMSTRSGDLDPSIPLWLQRYGRMSLKRVSDMLEQRSGLFGIAGLKDMRDILAAIGHPVPGWPRKSWTKQQRTHAQLAFDIFIYDAQRYLASYSGLVERLDAIVFTGPVGENPFIQKSIIQGVPGVRWTMVQTVPAEEERAIAWRMASLYNTHP